MLLRRLLVFTSGKGIPTLFTPHIINAHYLFERRLFASTSKAQRSSRKTAVSETEELTEVEEEYEQELKEKEEKLKEEERYLRTKTGWMDVEQGSKSLKELEDDIANQSRFHRLKKAFRKPLEIFNQTKISATKKYKKGFVSKHDVHRSMDSKTSDQSGRRYAPKPDEGIMTHIPTHKAHIIHILQEECAIFPDEVFPLFPDPKTEAVLADAQDWHSDDSIRFIDNEDDENASITANDSKTIDMKSIEDEQQSLLTTNSTEIITTKKTALAKIETKQMSIADLMAEKPVVRHSQIREQRVSGITSSNIPEIERGFESWRPFKLQKVLTPDEVQKLSEKDQKSEMQIITDLKSQSHAIWSQESDTVYEIILLLRELGFKTNQTGNIWPYTEFKLVSVDSETNENQKPSSTVIESPILRAAETEMKEMNEKEIPEEEEKVIDSLVLASGTALNPNPDTFNDFFLLFSRFPEILTMELKDIRRKLHILEQYQIDDIRIVLLKDPRLLRRPSHHLRWLLEVLDDCYIKSFNEIIELSPHFLSSTSKKEILKRLNFIHTQILVPYETDNNREIYPHLQRAIASHDFRHPITVDVQNGQISYASEKSIAGFQSFKDLKLDESQRQNLANFVELHPDFIGNATEDNMNHMLFNLRNLCRIKNQQLNELIYNSPQILSIDPLRFKECISDLKRNGVRDIRSYIIDNVHEILPYNGVVQFVDYKTEEQSVLASGA